MKYLSLIVITFALFFTSCDLQSPDRSGLSEMPAELIGEWYGTIYNVKSDAWAVTEDALVGGNPALVDLDVPNVGNPSLDTPDNVQDGVRGVRIISDSMELIEVLYESDGIVTGAASVETTGIKAELQSKYPDVGYMVSGDLLLTNPYLYDGATDSNEAVSKIVSGTVHFPSYTDTSSIESALRDEIYNLLEEDSGLTNSLRQAHKDIIDEYIEFEDIFGYIDGVNSADGSSYIEGGLNASGTDKLNLMSITWGYNGETGESEFDTIEILCNKYNVDWLTEATIRLSSVAVGRNLTTLSMAGLGVLNEEYGGGAIIVANTGAFGDPRWTEILDIEE